MDWLIGLSSVAAAGFGLWYAGSCWVHPLARCWWPACDGGRIYRSDRKVWRECRLCSGSGKRIRVGRRIFNYWYQRRREAR